MIKDRLSFIGGVQIEDVLCEIDDGFVALLEVPYDTPCCRFCALRKPTRGTSEEPVVGDVRASFCDPAFEGHRILTLGPTTPIKQARCLRIKSVPVKLD
jgi:hypothetical protein